jgi:hypothetical protein
MSQSGTFLSRQEGCTLCADIHIILEISGFNISEIVSFEIPGVSCEENPVETQTTKQVLDINDRF